MVFTGTYEHTIDTKHRLAVPSDVRRRLQVADTNPDAPIFLYVTLGEMDSLCLYSEKDFERRAEELESSEMEAEELLAYERLMFSLSARVEMDAQGRVRLPENLLRMSKLGSDVVLIGVKDHLEIRDRSVWLKSVEDTLAKNPKILMNPRLAMRQRKASPSTEL